MELEELWKEETGHIEACLRIGGAGVVDFGSTLLATVFGFSTVDMDSGIIISCVASFPLLYRRYEFRTRAWMYDNGSQRDVLRGIKQCVIPLRLCCGWRVSR
jgi:hypothetical protein